MEKIEHFSEQPFEFKKGDEKLILERQNKLQEKISDISRGISIPDDNEWNLSLSSNLGISTVYNSPRSALQFLFALAMSNDELVEKILQDNTVTPDNFDIRPMLDKKILSGLKSLDLGCGLEPVFDRMLRALGADAYTLDVESADKFDRISYQKESPLKEIEIAKHLQLDIHDENTIDSIIEKTGGEFNFLTEAHFDTDGGQISESNILKLLKKGGIYYKVSGFNSEVLIKE